MRKEKDEVKKRPILKNLGVVYRHMLKWHPESIAMILVNSLAVALAPFIWVIVPKLIIDELEAAADPKRLVLILTATLIISAVVHFTKEASIGFYRMKMSRVRMLFGMQLHEKAMKLDYHHVENADTQNLLHRATRTTSNPNNGMGGVMKYSFSILGYGLGFVGYVGILMTLHPLILAYLLGSVLVLSHLKQRGDKYIFEQQGELKVYERKTFYLARTMTDFEFGKDTRIYQLKDMLLSKMKWQSQQQEGIYKRIIKKVLTINLLDALMVLLRDGMVLGYISYLTLNGRLTLGSFMLYVVAVSGFAQWMQELMRDYTELKLSARYMDEYLDFMAIDDPAVPEQASELPKGNRLSIQFQNVDFNYPGTETKVFENLNLEIPAGQKLAVVGVNGAGKTSLIKLLTGLYRPTSGCIAIDGIDIATFKLADHFDLFSVVFQEIKPFASSIAENVAGGENYDETRVWDALERSGLRAKVESLDLGIHTPLLKVIEDNGLELSGGENQKLALARALYKNGPIVILDEPTAALDPIAEKDIYESFSDMIDGRTAIFISHRLSSTKFCDMVAYFEGGKILEYGTHDELLALNGKYAHMFNVQAAYYQTQGDQTLDMTQERGA